MNTTALLLIDMQNDYFPGGKMALEGIESAADSAGRLLQRFRKDGLPLFHIQHVSLRPNAPFFLPNTPGVEIHASVSPRQGERVVTKHFPNAFRDTPLPDELRAAGITDLVICGAMSHMCIDATTRAAFDAGFKCTVAHDACATRAQAFGGKTISAADVHAAFMAALSGTYAKVCAAAEVLV